MVSLEAGKPTPEEIDILKQPTFLKQIYDILKPLSEGKNKIVYIAGIHQFKTNLPPTIDATLVISSHQPKFDISDLNDFGRTITNKLLYLPKPFDENSPCSFEPAFDKKGGIVFPEIVFDQEFIDTGTEKVKVSTTVIICPSQQIAKLSFLALTDEFDQIPPELKATSDLAYGIREKQLELLKQNTQSS